MTKAHIYHLLFLLTGVCVYAVGAYDYIETYYQSALSLSPSTSAWYKSTIVFYWWNIASLILFIVAATLIIAILRKNKLNHLGVNIALLVLTIAPLAFNTYGLISGYTQVQMAYKVREFHNSQNKNEAIHDLSWPVPVKPPINSIAE